MRIAILGTRGIPARYGGFETCAEEVAVGLQQRGHDVTVYARRGNAAGNPATYKQVTLRYARHLEYKTLGTLSHAFTSTVDAVIRRFDVVLYFNAATAVPAVLMRVLGRRPFVINVDGLEWRRRKWGAVGRGYYQFSEWLSGRIADRIISDSMAIQRYYDERWHVPSTFVAYGAHVERARDPRVLKHYALEPDSYFLVASRLEPENNADIIVRAFGKVETDKALIIAGGANWDSLFVRDLSKTTDPRVRFLGPVYDDGHIRELHCGAFAYVHGNEVGGTNPALLKALGYGNCVLAIDVPYNAEVVRDAALLYPRDADALAARMRQLLAEPKLVATLRKRATLRIEEAYLWDYVVEGYERVVTRAASGGYRRPAPRSDIAFRAVDGTVVDTSP